MSPTGVQRRQLTYSGHVQGVGFRYATRSIARKLEVDGYVRNLPNGCVELVVEGTSEELDKFLDDLAEQMAAHIRSVDSERYPATGEFAEFSIRY